MSNNMFQFSTFIPNSWKPILEQEARIRAVQEHRDISYIELIKLTLKEKFNLPDEEFKLVSKRKANSLNEINE